MSKVQVDMSKPAKVDMSKPAKVDMSKVQGTFFIP